MTFKEKIDKLLSISGKKFNSVYDLEQKSGVGMGTIRKAYDENREPSKRIIWKFLESLGINTEWWETEKGEIYLIKPTQDDKMTDNNGKAITAEEVFKGWLEGSTEYRLVPKTILDEEYRIMLKSEIDEGNKKVQEVIAAKNELIKELKDQLADLRSRGVVVLPAQEKAQ